jgi:hypothetical protein
MLVLEEEQGSPAPGAIERTLLDHAYRRHAHVASPGLGTKVTSSRVSWLLF